MALKAIVLLLACAVVARSQAPTKLCSVDDLTGEALATQLKQIIETLVQDIKSFSGWVIRDANNAIAIAITEVTLLTASRIPQWEDALKCAEASPVNQTDLQGCYDPRPDLQNITRMYPEDSLSCINSFRDDLLESADTYTVDTVMADNLMDQATTVASSCQCRSDCLADLIPILIEAEQLSRNVSALYNKLAINIADFNRNVLLCGRNEYIHYHVKWGRALERRTRCIEDKYTAVSRHD